jgi:hypothetical protein
MAETSVEGLPRDWSVTTDGDTWRLIRTWRRDRGLFAWLVHLVIVAVGTTLVADSWIAAVSAGSPPGWLTWLLTPLLAFWGLVLVLQLFNRTVVEVDPRRLTVKVRPIHLPIHIDREVDRDRVTALQVFVEPQLRKHAGLNAVCSDGTLTLLMRPVLTLDVTAAVQRALAARLGVPAPEPPPVAADPPALPTKRSENGPGWLLPALIVVPILYFVVWPIARDGFIYYNGVDATATILEVRQTNSSVNRRPVLAFKVEVHPPDGGPAFTAEADSPISLLTIPRLQVGATIRVKYLASAPSWISIEEE